MGGQNSKEDPDPKPYPDPRPDPDAKVNLEAMPNADGKQELHGPTLFAPVIKYMARQAQRCNSKPTDYSILLIITDGIITDMEETKRAIIKASGLPLSIIIVGVGDEDFSQMKQLDSDTTLLQIGTSSRAKRDIVQFIEMKTEEEDDTKVLRSKEDLAKEVLQEVPKQVTDWMYLRKFASAVDVE